MNGKISKIPINTKMVFCSEAYCKKNDIITEKLYADISGLIENNHAVMFTWQDKNRACKRIFFPYADSNGDTRIAHIVNDIPFSHSNDIRREIFDLISVIRRQDVYFKTA